jgi:hypothetical protein
MCECVDDLVLGAAEHCPFWLECLYFEFGMVAYSLLVRDPGSGRVTGHMNVQLHHKDHVA